ncbi:cytochrome P450 71B36-like [Herrania umbratica]|uniref:Cytochrome P450 71B36-like n=1 Tax=Herrania umbratica TaxID=108875 RepID=A0A6J1B134_9ROSI|nr:cytochrome P450 71B36-like [Herrania umbratica]
MWLPLLLLLSLLLLIIKKIQIRKKGKLPPGPPKLPILGNLHQLGALPHRSTWKLSKKHGPIMLLQLGAIPTIIVSSAETAREVLKTHDLDCCSRPPLAVPKRLSYNFLDIGFVPYGYYWREMRKICVTELFSMKRVQSFQSVREDEVTFLINSISESANSGSLVNLSKEFFSLHASITFRIAFGKIFQGSELDNDKLQKVVNEAKSMLGAFCASDFLPYFGWMIDWLTGFHRRLESSFNELDDFFQKVIDDHLNSGRTMQEHEDIVDVLLRMERDQTENSAIQITKDHIKAILMDIFLAGIDTGALTMIWAMTELARKPTVMKKAQYEIRRCVGKKGKVTDNDVNQLLYLQMIIKETLRLHPPAVLLLPRETVSQFKIGDYDVYPKTRIAVNVWAIGRDPDIWKNPEEFLPERFNNNPIDFKGQHFELLPFGAGRRICPGMNMGTALIELALANLLYHFDWKLPSGGEIDMEEEVTITVGKKSALNLMPINYISEDDKIQGVAAIQIGNF